MGIAIQQDNALSEFTHRVQDQLNAKLREVLKQTAMPQNFHTFGPINSTPSLYIHIRLQGSEGCSTVV